MLVLEQCPPTAHSTMPALQTRHHAAAKVTMLAMLLAGLLLLLLLLLTRLAMLLQARG